MAELTEKDLMKIEDYYYLTGYKHWYPFPCELKKKLLAIYAKEPFPHEWTEQDIFEGSRKIIMDYFKNNSN
ncbi:hypothetical protein GCM10022244_61660 [Streptomyces gulbargensis]|uniref:Uncharacterized protein n=1 Tax=Streptomyces gulbargensis TaxID=364901 RepID=A0ABP7NJD9_9ACTN